jgi:hypothetical protein
MPIAKPNLAGIGVKPKASTKKNYPELPSTPETESLVADYINLVAELDALEGDMKLKRSTVVEQARSFFFPHYHGKTDVESSVEAKSATGESLLVTFSSRYKAVPDESLITDIVGPDLTERFFQSRYEIKIDGDKIPVGKADELLGKMVELFQSYSAADALSQKSVICPTPEFHTARHTALSVEQNLAIDNACPIVVSVKTKGRK